MTEEDLRRCEALCRGAGYAVVESQYDARLFGSWWLEVAREDLPRQQLIWDGKDGWLIVRARSPRGEWIDKWIAREKSEQSAEAALAALDAPVARAWGNGD